MIMIDWRFVASKVGAALVVYGGARVAIDLTNGEFLSQASPDASAASFVAAVLVCFLPLKAEDSRGE